MAKKIDFKKSVYELVQEYPERTGFFQNSVLPRSQRRQC